MRVKALQQQLTDEGKQHAAALQKKQDANDGVVASLGTANEKINELELDLARAQQQSSGLNNELEAQKKLVADLRKELKDEQQLHNSAVSDAQNKATNLENKYNALERIKSQLDRDLVASNEKAKSLEKELESVQSTFKASIPGAAKDETAPTAQLQRKMDALQTAHAAALEGVKTSLASTEEELVKAREERDAASAATRSAQRDGTRCTGNKCGPNCAAESRHSRKNRRDRHAGEGARESRSQSQERSRRSAVQDDKF